MNLANLPRRRYTQGSTPIEKLENLTELLGGPEIYIKRDDLLGLTSGGNKTRKLEFLVADALEQGADTLVTCGAVQSNHCRLTLSAARKEKLDCHLVLEERVPGSYREDANGNNFLFNLLKTDGVSVVEGGSDMMAEMEKVAVKLRAEGKKPYIIPGGGSNEIGAAGYVACAQEIMAQLFDQGLEIDCIVTPSGSAGTHAGLTVGLRASNNPVPIVGISVNKDKETQENNVYKLVEKTRDFLQVKSEIDKSAINVYDNYVGPGYSLPTEKMVEAIEILAQQEGILLDPVYTGKVMAGFIDLIRQGYFKKGQKVLFLHTGGSPALYDYTSLFQKSGASLTT
ncbi:D-cysteine desulfhydrase [Sporosarcina sp. P37]|uniref:D-cysteine desulfhydrase n=1 Tax=unclassified Sporosarcina TaxID=2647733 RepID=UPI0009BDE312|nr:MULTISPECIES: D-cysteine desulfhydrase [unclassified Sporosarcina]ARD48513.1 D-cysteine desulfhydrase [Sporosarcina sp. P33]ARK25017.1 D-cysteine desulfhydrase [Sporosarcina sp. P37]PID18163.1 D-cysteine desulfhydrase [Sporosarcina sp. P35]